jgi:hypothetical protein
MLQCLMNVFEKKSIHRFFLDLIHMFQWYIMNLLYKNILYFQHQIKLSILNLKN